MSQRHRGRAMCTKFLARSQIRESTATRDLIERQWRLLAGCRDSFSRDVGSGRRPRGTRLRRAPALTRFQARGHPWRAW